jgi:hypothetical protein
VAYVGICWGVGYGTYFGGVIRGAGEISGYLCCVEFDCLLGMFLCLLGLACMATLGKKVGFIAQSVQRENWSASIGFTWLSAGTLRYQFSAHIQDTPRVNASYHTELRCIKLSHR